MRGKRKEVPTDEELVAEYMQKLDHPYKQEIEALRIIIRKADSRISERIKWNAPSYYYIDDFLTFNLRASVHIHLVFHHPCIEKIRSGLLEGEYKGRRMVYLKGPEEVESKKAELTKVIRELIVLMGEASK
jgi:hypothetical protein